MGRTDEGSGSLEVETDGSWPLGSLSRRSLLVRVGLAMTAISTLAIVSMLTSIIIAETAKGDAAAINIAGTLRMQTYRLADALRADAPDERLREYVREFRETLEAPALTGVIPDESTHPLTETYHRVHRRWDDELAPEVTGDAAGRQRYLAQARGYVGRLDSMVRLLQQEAEKKIQLLRLAQGLSLFVTIALVFFSMYRILTDVVPPLRELVRVVEAARRGDLGARTSYRGDDEIGLISRTFNRMAANLQAMYGNLEERVRYKTARLEESNRALQVLYDTARRLSQHADRDADYADVLARLETALGVGPLALCLTGGGGSRRIVAADGSGAVDAPPCPAADALPAPGGACLVGDGVLAVPLAEGDDHHGALLVRPPGGNALPDWQLRLCETVAGHIATALGRQRREADRRRLALMDERAVIARELHDSLAQALSYLKIQTARLEAQLRGDPVDRPAAAAILAEIREGLSSAYQQLRQLLSTFRLRLGEGGLEQALTAAVDEFADRGGIGITLDHRVSDGMLTPNEELHTVQIVREALANVVQHANARHARVRLCPEGDRIVVTVTDDGTGMPPEPHRRNHYGTTIMQERARGLGGEITFGNAPEGGTVVRLAFQPALRRGGPGPGVNE